MLLSSYETRCEEIKKLFESIDEDGNGFLEPMELNIVSEKLGKPMSVEEIEQCLKAID